jgi:hypothetical protein
LGRDERKRQINERRLGSWEDLPGGGRRYWYDVEGRRGWRARCVKEVDADETTVRFWQEIYDGAGVLGERLDTYLADRGHRAMPVT